MSEPVTPMAAIRVDRYDYRATRWEIVERKEVEITRSTPRRVYIGKYAHERGFETNGGSEIAAVRVRADERTVLEAVRNDEGVISIITTAGALGGYLEFSKERS